MFGTLQSLSYNFSKRTRKKDRVSYPIYKWPSYKLTVKTASNFTDLIDFYLSISWLIGITARINWRTLDLCQLSHSAFQSSSYPTGREIENLIHRGDRYTNGMSLSSVAVHRFTQISEIRYDMTRVSNIHICVHRGFTLAIRAWRGAQHCTIRDQLNSDALTKDFSKELV